MPFKNRLRQWAQFKTIWPKYRSLGVISDLLAQASTNRNLQERMLWLEEVLLWLKKDSAPAPVRFKYLLQLLDQNPEWEKSVCKTLIAIFHDASFLKFFLQMGVSAEHGLWSDLADRVLARVLPMLHEGDVREIILRVFTEENDVEWILSIPEEVFSRFHLMLQRHAGDVPIWVSAQQSLQESFLILSANIAHHGFSPTVRSRLMAKNHRESSFWKLSQALNQFSENSENPLSPNLFADAREDIDLVFKNMNAAGVSVALVHKLEVLSASIDQAERLLKLAAMFKSENSQARDRSLRNFIANATEAAQQERSVKGHLQSRLYLLSRRIAERNGYSGEHYISHTAQGLRHLFVTAMGGGLIVVLMTFGKFFITAMHPPPLIYALQIWFVYSGGFLLMQFFGLTLATKLPSFTASHLARVIKETRSREDSSSFTKEVRHMLWSQGTALAGNILGATFLCLIIYLFVNSLLGGTVFSEKTARDTLESFNPIGGPVVLLAILTGCELWVSSLCGGWFENWLVFRRIPEAIADHPRLKKIFGGAWTQNFSLKILKNASGIGTNVSLGFIFALVPMIGAGVGISLENKHVTLSTASALLASTALNFEVPLETVLWASFGLLLIGIMNLAVSFTLALFVAARAQGVKKIWLRHLIRRAFSLK